jgi:voltage-gated potassium channel
MTGKSEFSGQAVAESPTATLFLPVRTHGPVRVIAGRVALALFVVIATAVIVYVERAGYKDATGTPLTFLDALYYSTVTLSTTGYGDIVPTTETARAVNAFVITPMRFIFLTLLISTTVEVLARRSRLEWRRNRWRSRVQNHVVVIGFGVQGRAALDVLLKEGTPVGQIVVITEDPAAVADAGVLDVMAVRGDARRDETLEAAQVAKAAHVIVALNSDADSVLVTLNTRRVNPTGKITVAVRESSNAALLRQSGADSTIISAEAAGRLLAMSVISPGAGSVVEDLLDPTMGLQVHERQVRADEVGSDPLSLHHKGEFVLGTIRDGVLHRFDKSDITALEAADVLVVIRDTQATPTA